MGGPLEGNTERNACELGYKCARGPDCVLIYSPRCSRTHAQRGINRRKLRTLEAQNTAGESPVVDVRVADGRGGGETWGRGGEDEGKKRRMKERQNMEEI